MRKIAFGSTGGVLAALAALALAACVACGPDSGPAASSGTAAGHSSAVSAPAQPGAAAATGPAQPTALTAGPAKFCGIFTPAEQAGILRTSVAGAKASLGKGDYTCSFDGGPPRSYNDVVSTLELFCNATDASNQWQMYQQHGKQVPGDANGVRELTGSRGMAMAVKLRDGCVVTGGGAANMRGRAIFSGVSSLLTAMDTAYTANPHV